MQNNDLLDMNSIEKRSFLYAIRDELNLSMIDFFEYLQTHHSSIECDNVKKNFMYLTSDKDIDIIKSYVVEYIYDKIIDTHGNIDKFDIQKILTDNIDIFVEITENEHDVYIIELSK